MKKVILSITLLTIVICAQAHTATIVGNDSISVKKGDTVVVRQSLGELNFTPLPYMTTVITNGEIVQAGLPKNEGEKVWRFVVKADMVIIKQQGEPIVYRY